MDEVSFLVSDINFWIKFFGQIVLSILGLILYVIFKIWNVKDQLNFSSFISTNKKFWAWHLAATLSIAIAYNIAPEELDVILSFVGIDLTGKASFLMLGLALAGAAYGEEKKKLLQEIKDENTIKQHYNKN